MKLRSGGVKMQSSFGCMKCSHVQSVVDTKVQLVDMELRSGGVRVKSGDGYEVKSSGNPSSSPPK